MSLKNQQFGFLNVSKIRISWHFLRSDRNWALFSSRTHSKTKDKNTNRMLPLFRTRPRCKRSGDGLYKEKALGKASYNDAYHIAVASVNRLDVLVSWNFKHIVNYDKIKLFNSINMRLCYPLIDIRTPLEF